MSDGRTIDAKLIQQVRMSSSGDHHAFNLLVERHLAHVTANCEHLTGSRSDGEDMAQEVFVKAYFALGELDDGMKFRGWISRIKANHCLDHLRRARGRLEIDIDQADAAYEPHLRTPPPQDADWDVRERRERIRRVLEKIPESFRIPVVLCDMDGFSYQEIADSLGLGLSATKMRIKRGREMFRDFYARDAHQSAGASMSASKSKQAHR